MNSLGLVLLAVAFVLGTCAGLAHAAMVELDLDVPSFEMDLNGQPGFEINDRPAYSMLILRFAVE